MKKTWILGCVLMFVVGTVGATNTSMSAIEVGTPADVVYQKQLIQQRHAQLMKQQVDLGIKNPLVVNLTEDQRASIYSAATQWPMRVGVVAPVNAAVQFNGKVSENAKAQAFGAIRQVNNTMVWTTSVIAEGATGLRLHITGLDLPEGATLSIYNKRGEAFAYTTRDSLNIGDFWTHTMTGSIAYLQLSGADITDVTFQIADLGYLGDKWAAAAKKKPQPGGDSNLCTYNADCVENAGCTTSSVVADATKAVGHMQYVDGQYMYICSGGLINNESGKTYFLTANHCMSSNNVANTLDTYFFYEIGCNDSCLPQWTAPSTPRVEGAAVVATNETGDYTLLELGGNAPAGSVMLGWDATEIAHDNGTMLYRIAHPLGAPQAYSTHEIDDSYGSCGGDWPIPNWIYSQDVIGATQGGSSGSPVLNSNGQIVGQLSGGCGSNINDECDEINNRTVDGAFASYYDEIAGLLGGAPPCTDNDNDGVCAENGDCNDNNDSIFPGAEETCGDSIDQDCDGSDLACGGCTDNDGDGVCVEDGDCDDGDWTIYPGAPEICGDGIDQDCSGADLPCSCAGFKEYCAVDSDCCSGNCFERKSFCK